MLRLTRLSALAALAGLAACGGGEDTDDPLRETGAATAPTTFRCASDNGGITLPQGFCAGIVADEVGRARHLAVAPNGDVYVAVQGREDAETPSERGALLGLRDTDGDGAADERVTFGPEGGTGVAIADGFLYFATNEAVLRYRLGDSLEPQGKPDTLVAGLPGERGHTAKSIALGPNGELFVNVGSATNICQRVDRQPGLKAQNPCPELSTRAGVWRFRADQPGQTQAQGERWATGIRNAVALDWNPGDNSLYVVQHGRDQLNLWEPYTAQDNAERPAEELQRLDQPGKDFGWPYCWYDLQAKQRVLSPEYEGTGVTEAVCAEKEAPLLTFPGHWAPNDLLFYDAEHFPERYRGGAFVAFHGSWNRAPLPQAGYKVVFVPFQGGRPAGSYEDFADGFGGPGQGEGNAEHRPMGLALGPDGSLYISDDQGGRIWRVVHQGGQTASR